MDNEVRAKGIGGSEVYDLAAGKLHTVWRRKVLGERFEGNEATEFGKLLEAPIAEMYAKITGAKLKEVGHLAHQAHPIIIGSPDRIATMADGTDRVLEIKTAHFSKKSDWGRAGSDEIPGYYLPQVQWYMAITGLRQADVAVLFAGAFTPTIYTVSFDEELFNGLRIMAEEFWNEYVVTKKEPPLDNTEETEAWLNKKWKPSDETLRQMAIKEIHPKHTVEHTTRQARTKEEFALFEKALWFQSLAKDGEEGLAQVRPRIKELMADCERIEFGGGRRIDWDWRAGRSSIDWKAYALSLGGNEDAAKVHFLNQSEPVRYFTLRGGKK